jgi:hypothetical protein
MTAQPNHDDPHGAVELEAALTELAWADPSVTDDPTAALAQLGVTVPGGVRVDVRIQRRDTLYFVIPPSAADGGEVDGVVNQMDLWRSEDQFIWIMPQEAKVELLDMREQCRAPHDEEVS